MLSKCEHDTRPYNRCRAEATSALNTVAECPSPGKQEDLRRRCGPYHFCHKLSSGFRAECAGGGIIPVAMFSMSVTAVARKTQG